MKTIIIDDNKQAAENLKEKLGRYPEIEVVAIEHSGLDGLASVSEFQPDLLFLDVQLPDISGIDFLERVDSFTYGRSRVVMYTAYDEFVLPAFRKKAFDVLLKPIDDKELGHHHAATNRTAPFANPAIRWTGSGRNGVGLW